MPSSDGTRRPNLVTNWVSTRTAAVTGTEPSACREGRAACAVALTLPSMSHTTPYTMVPVILQPAT